MKRRIFAFLAVIAVVLWGIRVENINKRYGDDTRYMQMGQEFYYGGLAMTAEQAMLLTPAEYERKFGESPDTAEKDRIICVCFSIRNDSGEDLEWSVLDEACGMGFESRTWANGYDPEMCSKINGFYTEQFGAGETIRMWLVTDVAKNMFREKTWNNLSDIEFYYVLSTYPGSVKVPLKWE